MRTQESDSTLVQELSRSTYPHPQTGRQQVKDKATLFSGLLSAWPFSSSISPIRGEESTGSSPSLRCCRREVGFKYPGIPARQVAWMPCYACHVTSFICSGCHINTTDTVAYVVDICFQLGDQPESRCWQGRLLLRAGREGSISGLSPWLGGGLFSLSFPLCISVCTFLFLIKTVTLIRAHPSDLIFIELPL